MNHENVNSRSMDLHRRIALVLRKEPGLVRDFAERLRSKLAVARSAAVVSDEEWERYIIRHGYFSWILLGLIAGALAKFIMPGKDPGGIFVTILIGIAGAIVGGFLGSFIGLGKVESFDLGGIFIATIGAIILLIVYRLLRKRT